MTAKDAIRHSLTSADRILGGYVADLSDDDLLIRAVPGMNHVAWQLGHLLVSSNRMLNLISPGAAPALPEGFATGHSKETAGSDDPALFAPAATYKQLREAQTQAILTALDALTDADLDRADPTFPPFAPTVGALFGALSIHPMMHAGQFVAVRRALGKPVTM